MTPILTHRPHQLRQSTKTAAACPHMTNPQSVCLRTAGKGDRPERDFSANGESFHNRNCDSAAHRACQHRKELGPIKHLKQATNSARARHVMLARNPVISAGFYPPTDSSGQPARFTRRKMCYVTQTLNSENGAQYERREFMALLVG